MAAFVQIKDKLNLLSMLYLSAIKYHILGQMDENRMALP